MDDEEALVHERRPIISKRGRGPEMKIEIGPILQLGPRDTLLEASDRLFDTCRSRNSPTSFGEEDGWSRISQSSAANAWTTRAQDIPGSLTT